MGNLEKAGIGVVVVLLLVIMVVAFMGDGPETNPEHTNNPEQKSTKVADLDALKRSRESGTRQANPNVRRPGTSNPNPEVKPVAKDPRVIERRDGSGQNSGRVKPTPTPAISKPKLKEVTISHDDSLWKLCAKQYGARHATKMCKEVEKLNGLKDGSSLTPGQIVKFPLEMPASTKPAVARGGDNKGERPIAAVKPTRKAPTLSVHVLPFVPNQAPETVRIENDGANTYIVKSTDTLSSIAVNKLGSISRMQELADLNGIKNFDKIYAGMRLRLPKR